MSQTLTDDELLFLARVVARMSAGPWKINTDKSKVGENWTIGWALGYGQTNGDDQGRDYHIELTTDRVHCSELGGGAMEDATGIVALRNTAGRLIGEVRRLREREGTLDGRHPIEIIREATGIHATTATTAEVVRELRRRLDVAEQRCEAYRERISNLEGEVERLEERIEEVT